MIFNAGDILFFKRNYKLVDALRQAELGTPFLTQQLLSSSMSVFANCVHTAQCNKGRAFSERWHTYDICRFHVKMGILSAFQFRTFFQNQRVVTGNNTSIAKQLCFCICAFGDTCLLNALLLTEHVVSQTNKTVVCQVYLISTLIYITAE